MKRLFLKCPILKTVGVTAILAGACTYAPTDGERSASADGSFSIRGFSQGPNEPVRVSIIHPTTGEPVPLEPFNTRDSGAGTFFATRLWPFSQTLTVSDPSLWRSGARGRAITIEVDSVPSDYTLFGLKEDGLACWARYSDSLLDFSARCTSLHPRRVTICTPDYVHDGIRRGPCPHRSFTTRSGESVPLPDATTTFEMFPLSNTVQYRGDSVSYVDVYDENLATGAHRALLASHGMPYGDFVRVVYPSPTTSMDYASFNLSSIASLSGTFVDEWTGGLYVRQVDIGYCGTLIRWRTLLDTVLPLFERAIHETAVVSGVSATPLGRTSLTPVLRTGDDGDAIKFFQQFTLKKAGVQIGHARLNFTGALHSEGTGAQFALEDVRVEIVDVSVPARIAEAFGGANIEESRARMESRARTRILDGVRAFLVSSGLIIARDIVAAPEGLRIVLATDPDDSNVSLMGASNRSRYCGDANPRPPQTSGHWDVLFDPPRASDPPVFGDSF